MYISYFTGRRMMYSPLKRLTFLSSRIINRMSFLPCSTSSAPNTEDAETENRPANELLTKATTSPTVLLPYVNSKLQHKDYFNVSELVTINDLFKRRVHYGHKIGTLSENMKWALFGERLGVCIFDLKITQEHLIKALNFLAHIAYRGGIILFVSSDRVNMLHIEKTAEEVGQYSHTRKWQEGTLMNINNLFGAPVRLPDAIVMTSTLTSVLETHPCIIEAAKMTIPTVAVCDSNSDPNYITYAIPGNDDTPIAVRYYLSLFREAILRGQNERKKDMDAGKYIE
uniref:Small ribosomal subunit protein uS2m n=1 Tax=Strongyloides papillosus TaxID=174720 RepID=A0A0N5C037_STREA